MTRNKVLSLGVLIVACAVSVIQASQGGQIVGPESLVRLSAEKIVDTIIVPSVKSKKYSFDQLREKLSKLPADVHEPIVFLLYKKMIYDLFSDLSNDLPLLNESLSYSKTPRKLVFKTDNSNQMAYCDFNGDVWIVDINELNNPQKLVAGLGSIYKLAFNPGHPNELAVCSDQGLWILDISNPANSKSTKLTETEGTMGMVFNPNNPNQLARYDFSGNVFVSNLRASGSGAESGRGKLIGAYGRVISIAFNPSSPNELVVYSSQGLLIVNISNPENQKPTVKLSAEDVAEDLRRYSTVVFNPSNPMQFGLYTIGGSSSWALIRDLSDPSNPRLMEFKHGGIVFGIAFNPRDTNQFALFSSGGLRLWSLSDPTDQQPIILERGSIDQGSVIDVAFNPSSPNQLVGSLSTRKIRIWFADSIDITLDQMLLIYTICNAPELLKESKSASTIFASIEQDQNISFIVPKLKEILEENDIELLPPAKIEAETKTAEKLVLPQAATIAGAAQQKVSAQPMPSKLQKIPLTSVPKKTTPVAVPVQQESRVLQQALSTTPGQKSIAEQKPIAPAPVKPVVTTPEVVIQPKVMVQEQKTTTPVSTSEKKSKWGVVQGPKTLGQKATAQQKPVVQTANVVTQKPVSVPQKSTPVAVPAQQQKVIEPTQPAITQTAVPQKQSTINITKAFQQATDLLKQLKKDSEQQLAIVKKSPEITEDDAALNKIKSNIAQAHATREAHATIYAGNNKLRMQLEHLDKMVSDIETILTEAKTRISIERKEEEMLKAPEKPTPVAAPAQGSGAPKPRRALPTPTSKKEIITQPEPVVPTPEVVTQPVVEEQKTTIPVSTPEKKSKWGVVQGAKRLGQKANIRTEPIASTPTPKAVTQPPTLVPQKSTPVAVPVQQKVIEPAPTVAQTAVPQKQSMINITKAFHQATRILKDLKQDSEQQLVIIKKSPEITEDDAALNKIKSNIVQAHATRKGHEEIYAGENKLRMQLEHLDKMVSDIETILAEAKTRISIERKEAETVKMPQRSGPPKRALPTPPMPGQKATVQQPVVPTPKAATQPAVVEEQEAMTTTPTKKQSKWGVVKGAASLGRPTKR